MVDLNLFDVLNVLWQHLFADSFRAYFYILGVFLHTYCDRIFDCLWMHVSISEYNLHNCMLSNHSSCTSWSYSILFYLILSYSIVFYLILSYPILFYLILRFWPVGSTCVSFKLLCHSKYFMLLVSEFAFSTLWHLDQVSPIDLECVRPCLIRLPLDISCPNTSSGRDFYPLLWAWSFQMCPMDWLPSARSLETVGLRLLLSQAIMSSSSTNTMECQVSMAGRQSLLLIQKCASESSAPNLPMED